MKKPIRLHSTVIFLLISAWGGSSAVLSAAEDVPWGVASQLWPETLGSRRAHIQVEQKADAVRVHLPWRRRDSEPEKKNIVLVDLSSGALFATWCA